jgi:hypothetical protein
MTQQERLLVCMVKAADLGSMASGAGHLAADVFAGGDTMAERSLHGFSNLPVVGFMGNLGAGVYNLGRGRWKSALGDFGMGAINAFTGGAGGWAARAGKAGLMAGRAARAMPTFSRIGGSLGRGVGGAYRAVANPVARYGMERTGLQTLSQGVPGQAVRNWGDKAKFFGPKTVGNIGQQTVMNMDANHAIAPKNRAFDAITQNAPQFAQTAGNFMGGRMASDPRYMAPQNLPAPISTMFGS